MKPATGGVSALGVAPAIVHLKNHELEVLRAVAIAFTVLAHLPALLWYASGYPAINQFSNFGSGVDLFFCISGYIITQSIFNSAALPKKNRFLEFAAPFWIKRFFRLAPSAWLWICAGVALSYPLRETGFYAPFTVNAKEGLSAILQIANFHFAACRPTNTCGSLAIYWSLSLEEQFYLIFPVLVTFCSRRWLVAIMAITVAGQFFIPRPVTALLWAFRTDAIALGVLIAIWKGTPSYTAMRPRFLRLKRFSLPTFASLMFLLAAFSSAKPVVPFGAGMVAIVSALLVWIASYDSQFILRTSFVRRCLVAIGARSYVIYLTHFPALFCASAIWRAFAARYSSVNVANIVEPLIVFLLLTAVFSELTHRIVEDPLRRMGVRIARLFSEKIRHRRSFLLQKKHLEAHIE